MRSIVPVLLRMNEVGPKRKCLWRRTKYGDAELSAAGRRAGGHCGKYFIAADRIDTAEKVAIWAHHLSQKLWVTRESIFDFLDVSLGDTAYKSV